MALQMLALGFVIGITAMQAMHGLFSGMIMVMCSIVAAVVALGFFEPLNDFASQYIKHPNYAAPGVLVASFLLTLIILRLVADSLLRGNIRLPRYLDLGGSIACGFVSAQIVVGILMMGLLMLPLGERDLYQAYGDLRPDLIPSKSYARYALKEARQLVRNRFGENGGTNQIRYLFGNAPHLRVAEYRRAGQPGRSSRVLYDPRRWRNPSAILSLLLVEPIEHFADVPADDEDGPPSTQLGKE